MVVIKYRFFVMIVAMVLFSCPILASNEVTNVWYSSYQEEFQLVFEMKYPVEYHLFYLSSPSRIVIDFQSISFPLHLQNLYFNDPSVSGLRVGDWDEGIRVVLDLTENVSSYHSFTLSDPNRLVIEVSRNLEYERTFQVLIAPGFYYRHIHRRGILEPMLINILEIDLSSDSGLRLLPVLAQGRITGGEEVSSISFRYQALAGINGTFFDSLYRPLGLLVMNSLLVSQPILNRTAFGVTTDGRLLMDRVMATIEVLTPYGGVPVHTVNKEPQDGEVVLYNHLYGLRVPQEDMEGFVIRGGRVIKKAGPLEILPTDGYVISGKGEGLERLQSMMAIGDKVEVRVTYEPSHWNENLLHAVGGGPGLVTAGKKSITAIEESFRPDVVIGRAPRTALGITERGRLLMVTVSGRTIHSRGMTLDELADLMIELGAVEAMNLDGGGSTTMVLRQMIFNLPSSGEERKVSNALLILPY